MQEDPAKYREYWLQIQRMHLKEVEEKLGLRFVTHETDHYILHSTMRPAGIVKRIGNGCEDLYKKMSKAFDVQDDDPLWAGKCIIHLFENRDQFTDFAMKCDGFAPDVARNTGGYFAPRGRLVHIAIPKSVEGEKGFESTLIHEGAHAFLQLFREDIRIKPWIHEGVAQYFEHRCFPSSSEWQLKKQLVKSGSYRMSLAQLRGADTFITTDSVTMQVYYAYAWSALHFMIRANPKKFVRFLHVLKAGKSEEEAIQEAFGKSMRDFERSWLLYVKKSF